MTEQEKTQVHRCEQSIVHNERRFEESNFEKGQTQCHRKAAGYYNIYAHGHAGIAAKMRLCEECADMQRSWDFIDCVEMEESYD